MTEETFLPVRVLGFEKFSAATWETFRFEFDANGHLFIAGRDGWPDPICVVCDEAIRWCLDMFTFTTGPVYGLAHARCVWTSEAFLKQAAGPASEEGEQG